MIVVLEKIVVIGASGHASVIIDCIEKENKYQILGIINTENIGNTFLGYPILGDDTHIPNIQKNYPSIKYIIAIGDNIQRNKVYDKLIHTTPEMQFASVIHPSAIIGKNVRIDPGTVVFPGVIINANAHIKSFVILNTRAIIEHDCVIDTFSSINPNAVLGGNVKIGHLTVICMGASIIQNINIGKRNVIGANSLVLKDIKDNAIYYGTPARYIRERDTNFKYLK